MRKNGFTLIEMIMYVTLLSLLGIIVLTMYIQVQGFFLHNDVYTQRYIVRRYVRLVTESTLDFVDYQCTSAHTEILCEKYTVVLKDAYHRIYFIGEISNVVFKLVGKSVIVEYVVKIRDKVFPEQIQIYLI